MLAHREAEARLRAAERRTMDELGLIGLDPQAVAAEIEQAGAKPTVPSVGDVVLIRVPTVGATSLCTEYEEITTVVRHVGTSAIYLEDVANPLSESFTTQEYQGFDETLSGTTLPTIKNYFGAFADIRVWVSMMRDASA